MGTPPPSAPSHPRGIEGAPTWAVVSAFVAVYLIWGSTYLAILATLESLPPFLTAGSRFLLAGAILFTWRLWRGDGMPPPAQWRAALLIGGLLLLGGNGGVVWAQQRVPSGVAALVVGSVPAWMVLLEALRPGGSRPGPRLLAGLVLGFVGVAVLAAPSRSVGSVDTLGALVLVMGSGCWAAGSLRSRHANLPSSPLMSTSLQMLCGGALLFVAGLVHGELPRVDLEGVTTKSVVGYFYLVVFGSLVAFSCYAWLLRVSTPARVSTYAYVNPVVAVFLGWWLVSEPVTPRMLIAAPLILAGVVIITTARRERVPVPEAATTLEPLAEAEEGSR